MRLHSDWSGWSAHFGARITSSVDLGLLIGYADLSTGARYDRARGEDTGYLARLCAGDPSCAYEVRWHVHAGGPTMTIVGRLRRPDRDSAETAAAAALARILDTPWHVVAEPVDDADLLPFPPNAVAELRRRCVTAQPQRLDAGVRFYFAVPPLHSAPQAWADLLDRLTGFGAPLVISTGLRPTWVPPEFAAALDSIADKYDRLAVPAEFRSGGLYAAATHLAADPFARTAAPLFRDAAARYRGWVYRLRVAVVAPAPLDDRMLDWMAGVLGAVAERPGTAEDHRLAVEGLSSYDLPEWGAQPAIPPSLRLLRHLADPAEAANAVWLPTGLRGFPVTPPVADRTASRGGVTITDSTVTVEGDLFGGNKYGGI